MLLYFSNQMHSQFFGMELRNGNTIVVRGLRADGGTAMFNVPAANNGVFNDNMFHSVSQHRSMLHARTISLGGVRLKALHLPSMPAGIFLRRVHAHTHIAFLYSFFFGGGGGNLIHVTAQVAQLHSVALCLFFILTGSSTLSKLPALVRRSLCVFLQLEHPDFGASSRFNYNVLLFAGHHFNCQGLVSDSELH